MARRPRNHQPPHTNPPARTTPTQEPPVSDQQEIDKLISAGDHVASIARRCADAAYGRDPNPPTPDTVNAVLTAWRNAVYDAK